MCYTVNDYDVPAYNIYLLLVLLLYYYSLYYSVIAAPAAPPARRGSRLEYESNACIERAENIVNI